MLTRINPLLISKQKIISIGFFKQKQTSFLFTKKLCFHYHMSYLMDSKHDDRYVKIDRRAFHLYKDSILNFPSSPFNQKIFLTILIDTVRTKQKYEDFQQLAQYGLSHIDQIKQPLSIFSFATQLYLYNYPKKDQCYKLAKKGFQFFADNNVFKYSSYYVMKFLIFIEKNVGLEKFTDQDYNLINFTRFKPLFLCFTLEMFYQNNLQHYTTIQHLFELFTSSESIIPFADIHHYKLATKTITDPKFKEFIQNLNKRLINQRTDTDSTNTGLNRLKVNDSQTQNNHIMENQTVDFGAQNGNEQRSRQNKAVNRIQEQFPWQKAYSQHVYRQFTYYPKLDSSNQQYVQAKS